MQNRCDRRDHSQPGRPGSDAPRSRGLRRILDAPAVNVALFAFLLNYPWEFLQVPLFRDMPTAPHWEATNHDKFLILSAWLGEQRLFGDNQCATTILVTG